MWSPHWKFDPFFSAPPLYTAQRQTLLGDLEDIIVEYALILETEYDDLNENQIHVLILELLVHGNTKLKGGLSLFSCFFRFFGNISETTLKMYRACKYACLIENEAVWYPIATRFSDLSISSYPYNSGVHPLFHLPFAIENMKHVFVILRKFQVSNL